MSLTPDKLSRVLVTDCGSTTTKALLFEKTAKGWRQTCRGEAPTTVEEPVADVTVGALNAFHEIEELSGKKFLSAGEYPFVLGASVDKGIDLYLSTSSAGGGLQMMVAGVVREMSAESAERAALGAGAIVMDTISADDGREDHERIERIRHLRPDIVLLTGGVDGGSRTHVIEMAETLLAASPRPRFGETLKLPVIYAGNKDMAADVEGILAKFAQVTVVDNVRPTLEREVLGPAREAIHEFFLTHVMSHSPGYSKLLSWSPVPIMPTPAAVGDVVLDFSNRTGKQALCVDIGGATTDVFSTFRNETGTVSFNRTVSANYGMSYSVANVLVETGTENIARWLPYQISDAEVRDRLRNKMIRPTSIPQTIEDLYLEQAVCREALRLSLEHHRSLARGLSGVKKQRGIADIFSQKGGRSELVDLMKLDLVIGSGGVLSHAPNRIQAALMMIDGFGLRGVTQLAVDSIFMMPHLGVLASVHPAAAQEIFEVDCLVNIGQSIVPVFPSTLKVVDLAKVSVDGQVLPILKRDKVCRHASKLSGQVTLSVEPLHKEIDVGAGPGNVWQAKVDIGSGIFFDGRNRPIEFSALATERVSKQQEIFRDLGLES